MAITDIPNYRAPDDKVKGEGAEILAGEILTNCDLFVTQESKMVS